jgi:hypothetical protein
VRVTDTLEEAVFVAVKLEVMVWEAVLLRVADGVGVLVLLKLIVGVTVAGCVPVRLAVLVSVGRAVSLGDSPAVRDGVLVRVLVGVCVLVDVGVRVILGVGVGVASGAAVELMAITPVARLLLVVNTL